MIDVCSIPKKLCAQHVHGALGISCILMCTEAPGRQRPSLAGLSPTVPGTEKVLAHICWHGQRWWRWARPWLYSSMYFQEKRETGRQTLSKEGFGGQIEAASRGSLMACDKHSSWTSWGISWHRFQTIQTAGPAGDWSEDCGALSSFLFPLLSVGLILSPQPSVQNAWTVSASQPHIWALLSPFLEDAASPPFLSFSFFFWTGFFLIILFIISACMWCVSRVYTCHDEHVEIKGQFFCKSVLSSCLAEAGSFLLLLYYVLQATWPISFQVILLSLPSILL